MIYVMMALYQEAHGLIRELELKKNTAYAAFEVVDNESAGIRLVVTGVGEIAAAAAACCARARRQAGVLRQHLTALRFVGAKAHIALGLLRVGGAAAAHGHGLAFFVHRIAQAPTRALGRTTGGAAG